VFSLCAMTVVEELQEERRHIAARQRNIPGSTVSVSLLPLALPKLSPLDSRSCAPIIFTDLASRSDPLQWLCHVCLPVLLPFAPRVRTPL
jgi:hypothetical protein